MKILYIIVACLAVAFGANQLTKEEAPKAKQEVTQVVKQEAPKQEAPKVVWKSVACGHGFDPVLSDKFFDPSKIAGGWRLFESADGDYKIIYSVDEWELVMDQKEFLSLKPKLRLPHARNGDGTVVKCTQEPWWLYHNKRTDTYQFVYQEKVATSSCPNGQCPL